jgi:hypothetical protein
MATTTEYELYNQLMNSAPNASTSADTAASEAALSAAENSITPSTYNGGGADARLDAAINAYLNQRGFNYNTANDKDYQSYVQQYKENAAKGRELSKNTATQLANGYTPTYANAVASEVENAYLENISDAFPTFKNLAAQEYSAEQSKLANAVDIYNTQASTAYDRNRDTVSDQKNFLNYLYDRYVTDKQSDVENNSNLASIYGTKLSAAQSDLSNAMNYDNSRYQYDTQSADSKAQIAESEYENNQKIAYNQAKDEYDAKVAAAKAASETDNMAGNTQNANGILSGMKSSKDFNNVDFDNIYSDDDTLAKISDSEKIFDKDGVTTYEAYAKQYIDNQYKAGNISADEREYLYRKTGITGDSDNYYNNGIAESYIKAYSLDRANDDYIINQLKIGTEDNRITLADANYIIEKLGVKYGTK